MAVMEIECPPELATALGKRPAEVAQEIRLMAALKLYESGRISSGLAAQFAGVPRTSFLLMCGMYGVSVFQETPDEVEADAEAALHASGC